MAGDVRKGFREMIIISMVLGREKAGKTSQVWRTYIFMIIGVAIGINSDFAKRSPVLLTRRNQ